MVIDSSALLAILFAEPEARRLRLAIGASPGPMIGAPPLVEATAVVLMRNRAALPDLEDLVARLAIRVVPMTPEAARRAAAAYARYGKGVGAPGVLNFGDCLAYGVAAALGEPLLFKGDDFPRTDVVAARY